MIHVEWNICVDRVERVYRVQRSLSEDPGLNVSLGVRTLSCLAYPPRILTNLAAPSLGFTG